MDQKTEAAAPAEGSAVEHAVAAPTEYERMAYIRERYEHGATTYEVMVHPAIASVVTAIAEFADARAKATADAGVNT